MINQRELRIGNWVNYDGQPVEAICIGVSLNTFEYKGNDNTFRVMHSGSVIMDTTGSDKLSPIELTGAILLKLGFAKYTLAGYTEHFEYSKHVGGEIIRITALHNCDFSISLHHTARRITSLHDLQNKIFAVTGQELEVEFKEEAI